MEVLRAYLLSITGVALLCAVAQRILGNGRGGRAAKLLLGLALVLTVMRPLVNWRLPSLDKITFSWEQEAAGAVAQGKEQAENATAAVIKNALRAYILEKAEQLGASVEVEFTLSAQAPYAPEAAHLTGTASAYAKAQLQTLLVQELGISKENQQWT